MAKKLSIGIAVIVLVLDWLALDDITTGNESNLFGEYAILAASVPALLFVGYVPFKK